MILDLAFRLRRPLGDSGLIKKNNTLEVAIWPQTFYFWSQGHETSKMF
jgi:hypothetical protein